MSRIIEFSKMNKQEVRPGMVTRMVHGSAMSFICTELSKGSVIEEHSHEHEQIVNVVKGKTEVVISGSTYFMNPGDITLIEPNVLHRAKALEDSFIIDVFSPVREDYRKISEE